MTPRPEMKVSFIRYEVHEKERFILKVSIEESNIKPVILKYKNIPSIFMRRDGFTNGATYEEIIEMSIKSKNTQYDILTSDIKYNSTKISDLKAFYKKNNNGKDLKEKALRSLGFLMRKAIYQMVQFCFWMIMKGRKQKYSARYFQEFIRGVIELSL